MNPKAVWSGRILGVQPRIRLLRSYDESSHSYLGYVLRIDGRCGNATGEFQVAVGKGAQVKFGFRAGMEVAGQAVPVDDPRLETAGWYKASALTVPKAAAGEPPVGPPFIGLPPDLPVYRERGHRRLDPRTYEAGCTTCLWGCRMPVEMIVDPWDRSRARRYRFETFCYGPKSCPQYRAGAKRAAPGRQGDSHVEENSVDEDATAHRGPEE